VELLGLATGMLETTGGVSVLSALGIAVSAQVVGTDATST
jgi:hypothetical protein